MSLKSNTEENFRVNLLTRLQSNSSRPWLDPARYNKNPVFELDKIEPIKKLRLVYPIHSYEIFEMEDTQISTLQDNMFKKIDKYFYDIIFDLDVGSRVFYSDGDLKISLDYRVAIIYLDYNLTILSPAV